MSDQKNRLPVLPLTAGVVLPHMNVTIQIDSEEARAAVAAAQIGANRLIVLPKVGSRYAGVGSDVVRIANSSSKLLRRAWSA